MEYQVLVVEDDPDEARMTLMAVARIKPQVSVRLAGDGEEALKLLLWERSCQPGLVFLDLKLPKIHGLEVLRALREDPVCSKIPVVVFSSSADPTDMEDARRLGANDYVCKPIDWDDYLRAIYDAAATYLPSADRRV